MKKQRDGMSAKHLTLVRQCPCAVCRTYTGDVQAHHLSVKSERGIGMRATDRHAIPLCVRCHYDIHQLGTRRHTEWLRSKGVDDTALAEKLWSLTQDKYPVEEMRTAVFAHEPERVG